LVDLTLLNLSVVPRLAEPVPAERVAERRAGRAPEAGHVAALGALARSVVLTPARAEQSSQEQTDEPPEPAPVLLTTLEFELESHHLGSHERFRLKQRLPVLRAATRITVVGHADSAGPEEFNQRLSQQRADAAVRLLVTHGVALERITSIGRGEREPLPQGNSRRVEIYLGGTQ
jgi:outer membrane protein OmpA-like peptidoglycan-associated protein